MSRLTKPEAMEFRAAGGLFVKGIEGDYNNVVGLPLARVYHELEELVSERVGTLTDQNK